MRTYYRCGECLEIAVLSAPAPRGKCDCGGHLKLMGVVAPNGRLQTTEQRCKCDRRCTFAHGPSCDCVCQGANHGAGMEAEMEVQVDRGAEPRLKARRSLPARMASVAEFRAAYTKAKAYCDKLQGMPGRWMDAHRLTRLIFKARSAKCHKARMRLLADYADKPSPPPVEMRPLNFETPANVQGGLFA